MKRNVPLQAIIVALLCAACVNTAPSLSASLEHLTEAPVTKKVLDNGLTVLVKEAHDVPLAAIEIRFKTGSAREGAYLGSGISHFVEHMLFKGAPGRQHGDIEKAIKSYGGTINGFTSFDTTGYYITVRSEYFEEALALLVGAVMEPAFPEDEVEKERSVILKEIKMRNDDPGKRAGQLLWSTVYTTHPYHHPIIGYEDLLKRITREDLVAYHTAQYSVNNAVIGICGNVNTEAAIAEVEQVSKDYQRQSYSALTLPAEPQQITKRTYEERRDLRLARLLLGYQSIPIWHRDLFALDVLASVLGEGNSSLLYRRLVEVDKVAHSVSAYNYTPREPGVFIISVLLDEVNIPAALAAIEEEIRAVKTGTLDQAHLEKTKNRTLANFILEHETIESQARSMVEGEILVGNPHFSRHYLDGITGVERDSVIQMANRYLNETTQSVVTLLPERSDGKEAEETQQAGSTIEIQKTTLPNGMRILVREDHSLPVIALRAVCKGGTRVETPDINGISNITAEALLYGTKRRTREEIFSEIEQRGGAIGSFSGNNSFGFGMTVLSEHRDFGLALLADVLLNPAFPAAELEKLKGLILATIKNRDDDIFESAMRLFKQNLFSDHPYQLTVIGEEESVRRIDRDEIARFHKTFCVPSNLVVSVFGDVNAEETAEKIKQLFTAFHGPLPEVLSGKAGPIATGPVAEMRFMDKEQVVIIGGFKTITVADADRYAFSVLASILSGADGRLFYDVRDALGISYTQGAVSVPGLDPGCFLFYIATAPAHHELATRLIRDEIDRLRKEPVTEEELALAKADLIGAELRQMQSNSGLAFEVSLDELYGLGYERFKEYRSRITQVTKEDIQRIVRTYFTPSEFTVVTAGPLKPQN